jgi:hypothetical protein
MANGYWWVKMSSGGLKRGLKMAEVSRNGGGQLFKTGEYESIWHPNHEKRLVSSLKKY